MPPKSPGSHRGGCFLLFAIVALSSIAVAAFFFLRPVTVPDLRRLTAEDAPTAVKRAGLTVGKTSEVATTEVEPGLVAQQSPPGSTKVARRSAIDYAVAVEPTPQPVPNVVGLDEGVATDRLTESLYLPRAINVFDDHVHVGIVVAQTPPDGYELVTGQSVAVAVSVGANDGTGVAVPSVRGMSLEAATSTLEAAALRGEEVVANPTATYSGTVFRQLPTAGVMVPPGTTVLLVFDRL